MGAGEDGLEIVHRQRAQLHPDREAPLQLRNQVAGLGQVKGARGDEQDVVGLDHAVLGVHRGAFHQRQQVALHTLARHLGAAVFAARGHLVDLVDEDDAVLLGVVQRRGLDVVLVHQLGGLFVHQQLARLGDLDLARLALARAHLREQALELLGHLFHALRAHDLELRLGLGQVDLDFLVVQRAFAQALAHHLTGRVVGRRGGRRGVEAHRRRARHRHQDVEDAVFGRVFGGAALAAHLQLTLLLDGHVHQVADDAVHVLAHVAHLGELGGLHLDEGRVGQLGQAARDLGLADAGGADHQDVLGRDLGAQLLVHLLAAPAVAQRDGHGTLGIALADDVAVEFGDDLLRGHAHSSTSMVWRWLV